MGYDTVLWYNPGNRFALIQPVNGSAPVLLQLSPEEAERSPLVAGQYLNIDSVDGETLGLGRDS